jgi:hypothetical protein
MGGATRALSIETAATPGVADNASEPAATVPAMLTLGEMRAQRDAWQHQPTA